MSILDQAGDLASGDLISDVGIASQIGQLFTRDGYAIAGITIDTIFEEGHESTITITSQPVENGAEMSDHIYANPNVVTVSGIISDVEAGSFFDLGFTGFASKLQNKFLGAKPSRSSQGWAKLVEIQRSGVLIDLVTNLRLYSDVAMTSLSTKQNKDSSQEVRFVATFREVFIVATAVYSGDIGSLTSKKPSTGIAKANKTIADQAAEKASKGIQAGEDPNSNSLALKGYTAARDYASKLYEPVY